MNPTITGYLVFQNNEQLGYFGTLAEAFVSALESKNRYVVHVTHSKVDKCWHQDGRPGIVNADGSISIPD